MSYSARRGFSNGSQRRQTGMQERIAKLQEEMNAAQAEVEAREFTATSGGGAVEAKVNGKKEIVSLTIRGDAVDPEDVEMLQDLVVSALNEALRQAGEAMDQRVSELAGGMNVGGVNLGSLGL